MAREYERGRRAVRRGLEPEPSPALVVVEPVEPDQGVVDMPAAPEPAPVGAVELGVRADLAELGHVFSEGLAAAALVLARDLDNRKLATSHPSLAKALVGLLETLRRGATPSRGRLAVVQEMTNA